jgi:hypothetical protein
MPPSRASSGPYPRPDRGLPADKVLHLPGGGSVPELSENAGEVGAVCLAEPIEDPFGFGPAGRADRVQDAGAVLGQLDQGGAPIARIGPPLDQAAGFEGVDDLRGRAWRDVQVLR